MLKHYCWNHCVPRAPVCEVSLRPYLFTYCLNTYNTMHFTKFRHGRNATFKLSRRNRVKCIVLYVVKTIGEQVKTRRNLAHWGSWDTVKMAPKLMKHFAFIHLGDRSANRTTTYKYHSRRRQKLDGWRFRLANGFICLCLLLCHNGMHGIHNEHLRK